MFAYQLRSPASIRDLMDATEIICSLPRKYNKPILGNMIPLPNAGPALDLLQKAGIPFYASQDESARAMYALVRYARILANRDSLNQDADFRRPAQKKNSLFCQSNS